MLMEKKHIWDVTDKQEQKAIMDYAARIPCFFRLWKNGSTWR